MGWRAKWMGMVAVVALAGCLGQEEPSLSDPKAAADAANDYKAARYKADNYLARGNHLMAVPSLLKLLEERPNDLEVLVSLGLSYLHLERYVQAHEALAKAHQLAPNRGEIDDYLGVALMNLGRIDEAEQVLLRAVQDLSYRAREMAYFHLGMVYKKQHREPEMVAVMEKALALKPTFVSAHGMLAGYYGSKGQYEQERKYLKMALSITPDAPDLLELMAESYARSGQPQQAREMWTRIKEAAPTSEAGRRAAVRLQRREK